MATYTTIGTNSTAHTSFVVAAFIWRASPTVAMPPSNDSTWMLCASDLSALIDYENYPPTQFGDVPNGAYKDAQPTQQPGAVIWSKGAEHASFFSWFAESYAEMTLSETPILTYISPVLACGIALLGEEGKVAMISTYRFASIESDTSGLRVTLQGAVGEVIPLLYVRVSAGLRPLRKLVTIGANGTINTVIPAAPADVYK